MSLRLAITLLVCIVVCSEIAFSSGQSQNCSLKSSYILDRLHLMDKIVLKLSEKVESLQGETNDVCADKGWCVLFDFESGINGWTLTGDAFKTQPTYGDNPSARKRVQPSKHHGQWWIGGFENCPGPSCSAGAVIGDKPKGTMTSPPFIIKGNKMKFLIGGGCNLNLERVELVVEGNVVAKATGKCTESMASKTWTISSAYKGKLARIRLVDLNSGGWGHINFDHFQMLCN